MIKALKNKYALSNQGAKDLLKGIIYEELIWQFSEWSEIRDILL